ncbi:hypothetical protein GGR51DRAFT_564101 [Nemania sp. FL0031]|nr:hypothetical protein GGR51DRAFT_564101 [Nemania sp. FL0031]
MPGKTYSDSLDHTQDREESDGLVPDFRSSKAPRGEKVMWDKYKSILHRLYVKEAKTLPEVMGIMKDKYGYNASVKQCMLVLVAAIHRYMALYQLGEKWGWKKYNQGGGKQPQTRINKSRRPTSSEKLHEMPYELDVHDRDNTPLHEQLSQVFADQWLDNKSLDTLRGRGDVSRCLRPCLRWCQEEIQNSDTQPFNCREPESEGIDGPDRYYAAIQICIILLRRYNEPPIAPSRHRNWDRIAKSTIGFRPVGVLLILSALIVTVADNVCQGDPASLNEFDIAELGIKTANDWEDAILVAEFCDEFEAILKDDHTLRDAIQKYIAHNYHYLGAEQMHFEDPWGTWAGTIGNQVIFPGDDPINFTEYQPIEIGHAGFPGC